MNNAHIFKVDYPGVAQFTATPLIDTASPTRVFQVIHNLVVSTAMSTQRTTQER